MQTPLRTCLSLIGLLLASHFQQAFAQSKSPAASGYIPWFTVQNKTIVVQTGSITKPLAKDVTLPNGSRVEYRTQSIVLADGRRVVMQEGDLLNLNGEFIRKKSAAAEAPRPTAKPAVVAVPTPVPVVDSAPTQSAFPYRSTIPVNGKLKGVVELSPNGFNLFVVRVDANGNWKLEKSDLGNSTVVQKMGTEENLRNELKRYISQILDAGVAATDVHFAVSSAAASTEGTPRIVRELGDLHYAVTTVVPESEGEFSLRSALPPPFADKAFVVDIGPINTKISWVEAGQPHVVYTYGTRYLDKNVDAAEVTADIKAKAAQVPVALRGTCFIVGEIPSELAKAGRQGQEPYTVLRPASAYPAPTNPTAQAGMSIYQGVAAATGCATFVYNYDTNLPIGYLLSLP